ncbi:S-layer homology domain-containing protein [Tumebacillus sp. ITR2]|uniref:S-layer homology domain-containing protein n=1 Tax=Tumebacillus amylolyticus TaxID=2801339 RepID=A0ABS1J9P0_9BACL|nr:S-layer homology domain-containing protein [Tumebacillus amylolyticus]MBL0386995.1 S-layer homology domain-containing protein [Tumebacillus amylolyticus]
MRKKRSIVWLSVLAGTLATCTPTMAFAESGTVATTSSTVWTQDKLVETARATLSLSTSDWVLLKAEHEQTPEDGSDLWYLAFSGPHGDYYDVVLDGRRGEVTNLNRTHSPINAYVGSLTQEEARERAESLLRKLAPERFGQYVYSEGAYSPVERCYRFEFERFVDGINVLDNTVRIALYPNGDVFQYAITFTKGDFPKQTPVLSEESAQKLYRDSLNLRADTSAGTDDSIIYRPTYPPYEDHYPIYNATTGKSIDRSGHEVPPTDTSPARGGVTVPDNLPDLYVKKRPLRLAYLTQSPGAKPILVYTPQTLEAFFPSQAPGLDVLTGDLTGDADSGTNLWVFGAKPLPVPIHDGWAAKGLQMLQDRGILARLGNPTDAEHELTRAELITMVMRFASPMYLSGQEDQVPEPDVPKLPYVDVPPTHRDRQELYNAFAYQWIADDTHFRPEDKITREEAAAVLARILGTQLGTAPDVALPYLDAADISPWAWNNVALNYQLGLMRGDGTNSFHPKQYITLAEMSSVLTQLSVKTSRLDINVPPILLGE